MGSRVSRGDGGGGGYLKNCADMVADENGRMGEWGGATSSKKFGMSVPINPSQIQPYKYEYEKNPKSRSEQPTPTRLARCRCRQCSTL